MKHGIGTFRIPFAAFGLGLLFTLFGPMSANADDDIAEMRSIARMANLITPERAREIALTQKTGVVTDVDLDRKRRGWVYEIEVVDAQGTEWEIELEGESGKVNKVKRDWF